MRTRNIRPKEFEEIGDPKQLLKKLDKVHPIRHAVLTEDGEVMEVGLMEWAYWLEKGRAQRVLVQEDLPGGYWISTVFLGLDQRFGKGPPLWFETMIFEPSDGKYNELLQCVPRHGPETYCDRYTTLKEALIGHEAAKTAFLARQNFPPQRKKRRPRLSAPGG